MGNAKHRDASHPNFIAPLPCQGGTMSTARHVYVRPRVFMHLLRLSGRRYGIARGIARSRVDGDIISSPHGSKFPAFQSKRPGQGLKRCCLGSSVSHQSCDSMDFMNTGLIRHFGLPHLQKHPIPRVKVIFAVAKMSMFVSQHSARAAETCRITHAWIRTRHPGVASEWMEP